MYCKVHTKFADMKCVSILSKCNNLLLNDTKDILLVFSFCHYHL